MRIVPSGTKRTVTAQQAKPGNPPPREGIQQEDITPAAKPAEGGDFNPMAKLDNTLQQQQQNEPGREPPIWAFDISKRIGIRVFLFGEKAGHSF
jgi:hypothetical protein